MHELDNAIHAQITNCCQTGDMMAESQDYESALGMYREAWNLLPEPKIKWDAATFVLAAMGDSHFLGGDYSSGAETLSNAMHCPDAIGNPFLHLRLGQCQYELGNVERAADELTRAYAIEGDDIFASEDPKYIRFLKTKIDITENDDPQPPGKPWWQFW